VNPRRGLFDSSVSIKKEKPSGQNTKGAPLVVPLAGCGGSKGLGKERYNGAQKTVGMGGGGYGKGDATKETTKR